VSPFWSAHPLHLDPISGLQEKDKKAFLRRGEEEREKLHGKPFLVRATLLYNEPGRKRKSATGSDCGEGGRNVDGQDPETNANSRLQRHYLLGGGTMASKQTER